MPNTPIDRALPDGVAIAGVCVDAADGALATATIARLKQDVLPFVDVTAAPYNADPTGATSSQTAFASALASGAKVIQANGSFLLDSGLTVPAGVTLIFSRDSVITNSTTGTIQVLDDGAVIGGTFDWTGNTGNVFLVRDADRALLASLIAFGSGSYAVQADTNCDQLVMRYVTAHSHAKHGIVAQDCTNLELHSVRANGNTFDGINLLRCTGFIIDKCLAWDNGNGVSYSGITANDSQDGSIDNCRAWGNDEHGIGVQGSEAVIVSNSHAYDNGASGFFTQSGGATYSVPNRVATAIHFQGCVSHGNNYGVEFIEDARDVSVVGGSHRGNTSGQIAFRDRSANGKKTQGAIIADLFTTGSGDIVNSNSSEYVYNQGLVTNLNGQDRLPLETVVETGNLVILGALKNYPNLFYVTPGSTINRTSVGSCVPGAHIYLMATGGQISIAHNASDGGGVYAPFMNKSGATISVEDDQCVEYIGNSAGTKWVQVGS